MYIPKKKCMANRSRIFAHRELKLDNRCVSLIIVIVPTVHWEPIFITAPIGLSATT